MARLYTLVFRGKERFSDEVRHHLHESPRSMTVPLVVPSTGNASTSVGSGFPRCSQLIAAISCGPTTISPTGGVPGGWIGIPEVLRFPNLLERYLAPVLHAAGSEATSHAEHGAGLEFLLMGVSFTIAAVMLLFGWACYERWPEIPARISERAGALYRVIVNKYYVDELYAAIVLRPYYALCRGVGVFDKWVVDGAVNAAGYFTLATSYTSVGFDTYIVDGLVNLAGYTVRGTSWVLRKLQTGVVQSYATAMILGIFVLVSVYLLSSGH